MVLMLSLVAIAKISSYSRGVFIVRSSETVSLLKLGVIILGIESTLLYVVRIVYYVLTIVRCSH